MHWVVFGVVAAVVILVAVAARRGDSGRPVVRLRRSCGHRNFGIPARKGS